MVAGGFQPVERKLRGDIFGGQIAAARAHTAAFEQIARQEFDVRPHALARDIVHLRPGGRSHRAKQQRAIHAVIITRPCRARTAAARILQAIPYDLGFAALPLRIAAQRLRCAAAMRSRAAALTVRRADGTSTGRPRLPRLCANRSKIAMARSNSALYARRSPRTFKTSIVPQYSQFRAADASALDGGKTRVYT